MTAPQRRRPATRVDVARLAGVSTAVVSYTLNGGPKAVAPQTAARVLDAVQRLGYRPNASAQALSRGTTQVIGLIMPDIGNPFFASYAAAVEAAARLQDLDVMLCSTRSRSCVEFIHHLDAMRVRGILLASELPVEDEPSVHSISTRVVQLDTHRLIAGGVGVASDLHRGAREATNYLLDRGHRNIAFLGDTRPDELRHAGWASALRDARAEPELAALAPFSREGGLAAMRAILASGELPTAVFASSDMIAVGALRALREAGLGVPTDVSLMSLDDSPESAFAFPGVTAVRQPIDEMARDAVAAVADIGYLKTGLHTYPLTIVERHSVAPPRPTR